MAIRYVCAVFDSAVQAYGQPFFVIATGAAVRSFVDECNREAADNGLYMHPEDYVLYQLGAFDDETGEFTPCQSGAVDMLIRGKDARKAVS